MVVTGNIYIVLMAWAALLSGYEYPEVMPTVVYADHSQFVDKLCDGVDTKQNPCVARAYYNDEDDAKIYLNTKYWEINREWTPYQRSIIVHEMVHYLQDISGQYDGYTEWDIDRLCAARKSRQVEAYQTQDKYLLEVYDHRRLLPRRYDSCGHQ
jgi:hypothetical protein